MDDAISRIAYFIALVIQFFVNLNESIECYGNAKVIKTKIKTLFVINKITKYGGFVATNRWNSSSYSDRQELSLQYS